MKTDRQIARSVRWTIRILGTLTVLGVVLAGGVYLISRSRLRERHPERPVVLAIPSDTASLARGEHLARISCYGCHRDSLRGGVMLDQPGVGRIVAANVPERLAHYSDAQLAGYLRFGVKADGTSGVVMPPPGLYHLSDADLASVIAYLRRQPKVASPRMPATSIGPLGRLGVVLGKFRTAVNAIDTTQPRVGANPAYRSERQGEYLARVVCTSCHGSTLTGDPTTKAPSLSAAVGYSAGQFKTLLREGTPNTGKRLTLMADVARTELTHFSDEEIQAVFDYLRSLRPTGVPR